MSLQHLAREAVLKLMPYRCARQENAQQAIALDANENPFWREDGLNRYPQPQPHELKQKLAQLYEVNENQILITRGSDEAIDLLIRCFCEAKQDSVVVTPPTYGMYEVSAGIQGANIKPIPLIKEDGFTLDKSCILNQWERGMKLIFLCSPNNPTGNRFLIHDILYLCQQLQDQALIIVDEAYIEFSTANSCSLYLAKHNNLVILRTLSKAYGLAGARLGSLLAHQDILALLKRIIAPYPIAFPVVEVVMQALSIENLAKTARQIEIIRTEREKLHRGLTAIANVEKVYPSEANFLLIKVPSAAKWLSHCAKNQIGIRSRHQMPGLEDCLRITVGTAKENQRLLEVLSHVKA